MSAQMHFQDNLEVGSPLTLRSRNATRSQDTIAESAKPSMRDAWPLQTPVRVSPGDELLFREMATQLLDRTLRDLGEHDAEKRGHWDQDPRKWKLLHTNEACSMYTRRDESPEPPYVPADAPSRTGAGQPSKDVLVCLGSVKGTLEDLLYGVCVSDSRSLALKTAGVDKHTGRSAVLAQLVGPTPEEPFRSLGLKWVEVLRPQTPVLGLMVKPRDILFVSASGTVMRPNTGEVVGYEIHHSVNLQGFPVVEGLTRSNMVLGAIYRRGHNGTVELFVKRYNAGLPSMVVGALTARHSAACMEQVWGGIRFAFAKKLRWCIAHDRHACSYSDKLAAKLAGCCASCQNPLANKSCSKADAHQTCVLCSAPLCSSCRGVVSLLGLDSRMQVHSHRVVICPACHDFVDQQNAREIASQECVQQESSSFEMLTPSTLEAVERDYSLDDSEFGGSFQDFHSFHGAILDGMVRTPSSVADTESL